VRPQDIEEVVDHGRGVERGGQVADVVDGVDVDRHVLRIRPLDDALHALGGVQGGGGMHFEHDADACGDGYLESLRDAAHEPILAGLAVVLRMRPPVTAWVVTDRSDAGFRHTHLSRQANHVADTLDARPTYLFVGGDDGGIGAPQLEEVQSVAADAVDDVGRDLIADGGRRHRQVGAHASETELARERDRLVRHIAPITPDDTQNPEAHPSSLPGRTTAAAVAGP
jgi:hypothetical protein